MSKLNRSFLDNNNLTSCLSCKDTRRTQLDSPIQLGNTMSPNSQKNPNTGNSLFRNSSKSSKKGGKRPNQGSIRGQRSGNGPKSKKAQPSPTSIPKSSHKKLYRPPTPVTRDPRDNEAIYLRDVLLHTEVSSQSKSLAKLTHEKIIREARENCSLGI